LSVLIILYWNINMRFVIKSLFSLLNILYSILNIVKYYCVIWFLRISFHLNVILSLWVEK
jgi:hypothetical protein